MWWNRAERHESCKKRQDELEDRIRKLEAQNLDAYLTVLDKAEQVAAKLKDRVRKREDRGNGDAIAESDAISQAILEGRYPMPRRIR